MDKLLYLFPIILYLFAWPIFKKSNDTFCGYSFALISTERGGFKALWVYIWEQPVEVLV